jgi:hypothetical protein
MARGLLGIADGAESEAVKLQAIKHALALGGISEKTAVDVSVTVKPYERMLQGIPIDGLVYEPPPPALERGAEDPDAPLDVEVVEDQPERPRDVRTGAGQGNGREPVREPYGGHVHVTGEDAYRQAAKANRAAGVWPVRRRR